MAVWGAFLEGEPDSHYYKVAQEKPSPLSHEFDEAYFDRLIGQDAVRRLSLKALLATEQKIPGLGSGILQDILFIAKTHPKKKADTLSDQDRVVLFDSVKSTISLMAAQEGPGIPNWICSPGLEAIRRY